MAIDRTFNIIMELLYIESATFSGKSTLNKIDLLNVYLLKIIYSKPISAELLYFTYKQSN